MAAVVAVVEVAEQAVVDRQIVTVHLLLAATVLHPVAVVGDAALEGDSSPPITTEIRSLI